MTYAYFGHHKCASTWVWEILYKVCREAGLVHRLVVDPATPSGTGPLTDYRTTFARADLGRYLREQGVDVVSCITADRAHVDGLRQGGAGLRGFHVIRDPRDILVSAYFSHRNSHPTDGLDHLAEHRERLKAVSKDEGLLLEMDFSSAELHALQEWDYESEGILEVKMETLTAHPYSTFLSIFQHLDLMDWEGQPLMRHKARAFAQTTLNRLSTRHPLFAPLRRPLPITGDMLLGRIYDDRFEKKSGGRRVGKSDASSHYRKGKAGDWRNHFTPVHAEAFLDRFGDLLVRTGYEPDHRWAEAPALVSS
jgi:hypothetical protein